MTFLSKETQKKLEKRGAMPGNIPEIEFVSTGVYAADLAIGGGFPKQRVTEITGEYSSSKTTLSLLSAARVIANDGYVALFETEGALDLKWLATLGIPSDEIYQGEEDKNIEDYHLHIYSPAYLESGLETLLTLYREDVYELMIFDSFGASPVRAAVEGTLEDVIMMKRARVGSQFKELFSACALKGHAAVVIINQVYTDNKYNPKYPNALKAAGGAVISNGGKSLPFLSAVRIWMKDAIRIATEKDEVTSDGEKIKKGTIIGKEHGGMIFKNKTGKKTPSHFKFRLMTYPTSYINYPWDVVETAMEVGVLEQRGHFWYYDNIQIAVSRIAMEALILTDPILSAKIEGDLIEHIHISRKANDSEEPANDIEEPVTESLPGSEDDSEFQSRSS